ncbi:hypothetical protein [Actinoplanes sp. NBRC 103695]|uniref:hypothetical protein n=1 Tax=Actinoplanes sp. NBRC 103695 TaxID=3032202 RepID=UPI0024A50C09|nr:hypothetical protein [Actinoplanes sp. NBRC 103695]GLZ01654.1 hypothetical protein Acsp02_89050 [Actinoplanes sp. NBRC 103695]
MTADEFGTVDVDLLADFIGDALDGPEQQRVARLVADDPEWRSAYARLAPAMDMVGAELGAMGTAAEPMPDDLWVRLEDAFTSPIAEPTTIDPELADPALTHPTLTSPELADSELADSELADSGLGSPSEPHLEPVRGAGDRHLVSVPTGVEDRKPTSRRRRLRWAAPIAAAAGVVAFAGFGAAYLTSDKAGDDASNSSAGAANAPMAAADNAERAAGGSLVTGPDQTLTSGLDYSEQSLRWMASAKDPMLEIRPKASGSAAPGSSADNNSTRPSAADSTARPQEFSSRTAAGLAQLRSSSDALQACLQQVALENGAGPIAVKSVDFAAFAGAPALIVRFTAAQTEWVWATGPDCGASGRGAQVRSMVRVG